LVAIGLGGEVASGGDAAEADFESNGTQLEVSAASSALLTPRLETGRALVDGDSDIGRPRGIERRAVI
jgi:hypothetical protein